jgi:hypothetical protein
VLAYLNYYFEDVSRTFIRNVGKLLPEHTALHPK